MPWGWQRSRNYAKPFALVNVLASAGRLMLRASRGRDRERAVLRRCSLSSLSARWRAERDAADAERFDDLGHGVLLLAHRAAAVTLRLATRTRQPQASTNS